MEECVKIMHVGAVACRVAGVSELFQIKKKKVSFAICERHGNFRV